MPNLRILPILTLFEENVATFWGKKVLESKKKFTGIRSHRSQDTECTNQSS